MSRPPTVAFVALMLACGGPSGAYTCDARTVQQHEVLPYCEEFTFADPARYASGAQLGCTGSGGTWTSSGACSKGGRVGTCTFDGGYPFLQDGTVGSLRILISTGAGSSVRISFYAAAFTPSFDPQTLCNEYGSRAQWTPAQ